MEAELQDKEPAAAAASKSIGTLLREARERRGLTLPEAAGQLRIRQPYLQAIESGRFQDLPGSAYAVGFVRSYAEFLGLDGAEIVRRFKQESGADFSTRELSFPSAVSEGSFPTGGMLFLALVLAVVAYGVWYWSSRASAVIEAVPALPDRLAALIHHPVGNGAEVVPATPAAAPAKPETAPASPAAATPAVPAAAPAQPAAAAPAAPAAPAPVKTEAPAAKAEAPAAKVEAPAAKAETPAAKAEAPAVKTEAPAAKVEAPAEGHVGKAETVGHVGKAETVGHVGKAETVGHVGKADEPVSVPADAARIILKAREDCWIRIRDASGAIVHSGILRKGTSFRVTQRPGQTLTAGNAAALEVFVDNHALPPLGAEGVVRKGLPLDADRLRKADVPAPVPAPAAQTPASAPAPAASGAAE